jgi:hypothetical protein
MCINLTYFRFPFINSVTDYVEINFESRIERESRILNFGNMYIKNKVNICDDNKLHEEN